VLLLFETGMYSCFLACKTGSWFCH
jgi:hypothetical protein